MLNSFYDSFPDSYDEKSFRIINTPSPTAKKTFFYVQETGYLKIRTPHQTGRRNLDSFLFVMVLSGNGTLITNRKNFFLCPYDCFLVDCRLDHSYQSSLDEPWELLWLHFNGATSSDYYKLFCSQSEAVFHPENFSSLLITMQDIIQENQNKNAHSEIKTSELILTLLTRILLQKKITIEDTMPMTRKLNDVKSFLDEHFTENLTLDELSERFFISKYYLTREYKKLYGESVFSYIISKRINYAKRLLRFTDNSIEKISNACGFHDQSYFNKQFRKAENITGKEYRKQWSGR